jgi:NAD+ diphosphatase
MRLFLFSAQDILVPAGAGAGPCFVAPLPAALAAYAADRRAFESGGERCEAYMLGEESATAACDSLGLRRVAFRQTLGEYDEASMKAALRALALLRALEVSRFCGACGAPLADAPPPAPPPAAPGSEESAGARICPVCGRAHFPRISPAIIVLIRKGPKILLARNAHFPQARFGLIAGFVEAGESLEETVVREVREEAGLEVGNIRYAMSQSWPFPDSLMLAFTADWVSGEARPDGEEIVELRWCSASELPDIPPPGSVARKLIDRFAEESRGAVGREPGIGLDE